MKILRPLAFFLFLSSGFKIWAHNELPCSKLLEYFFIVREPIQDFAREFLFIEAYSQTLKKELSELILNLEKGEDLNKASKKFLDLNKHGREIIWKMLPRLNAVQQYILIRGVVPSPVIPFEYLGEYDEIARDLVVYHLQYYYLGAELIKSYKRKHIHKKELIESLKKLESDFLVDS